MKVSIAVTVTFTGDEPDVQEAALALRSVIYAAMGPVVDSDLGCVVEQARTPVYDESFGDDRECACGHAYFRHFDTYEDMRPVGCKYCGCPEWRNPNG